MWRCKVTPFSPDFPILRSYSRYYATETEAVADAKRRVDKLSQPARPAELLRRTLHRSLVDLHADISAEIHSAGEE